MVRVKCFNRGGGSVVAGRFQFHNGSSKVSTDFERDIDFVCFYSTMVRVKSKKEFLQGHTFKCFNTTMVRVKFNGLVFSYNGTVEFQCHNGTSKISSLIINNLSPCCFNATMVRVKSYASLAGIPVIGPFQCHNGSSKVFYFNPIFNSFEGVSMPQWFE